MQTAQRVLLISILVFAIMTGFVLINKDKVEKCKNQWEYIKVEEFIRKLDRRNMLFLDEFLLFMKEVKHLDYASMISMEVYQKEWNIEGDCYYFLLSWEELQSDFEEEGKLRFVEGSVIKLTIQRNYAKNIYYTVISGKE